MSHKPFEISYRQHTPAEALRLYADWLLAQRTEEPFPFFACHEPNERTISEWYMIFYPLRTLMLATRLLGDRVYLEGAQPYLDRYLSEQLPNGAFTSNYRRQPTEQLTKQQFHELLRTGKVNVADAGSNIAGLIQAAMLFDGAHRTRYLAAARRWLDEWLPLWALPEGGYGNGIWGGHKINSPYTCGMSTASTALAMFTLATGEEEFVHHAERCLMFQCDNWQDDGQPINFNCYPLPSKMALNDYGLSFYLIEGMCWTHRVSKNAEVRDRIAQRLREWFFGEKGLLSQWKGQWFNFQSMSYPPDWEPGNPLPMSRLGIRQGWEMAKSNGIVHAMYYYVNHIDDDATLRETAHRGAEFLSHPLHARMSGVASDPYTTYGQFAVQATGFAGLSLAEAIEPDSVFNL